VANDGGTTVDTHQIGGEIRPNRLQRNVGILSKDCSERLDTEGRANGGDIAPEHPPKRRPFAFMHPIVQLAPKLGGRPFYWACWP
jgi:hypothetical protein